MRIYTVVENANWQTEWNTRIDISILFKLRKNRKKYLCYFTAKTGKLKKTEQMWNNRNSFFQTMLCKNFKNLLLCKAKNGWNYIKIELNFILNQTCIFRKKSIFSQILIFLKFINLGSEIPELIFLCFLKYVSRFSWNLFP